MSDSDVTNRSETAPGAPEVWEAPELVDLDCGLDAVRSDLGLFTQMLVVIEPS